MGTIKSYALITILLLLIVSGAAAQQNGSIAGQVFDSLGAVVVGANVVAVDANGKEKSVITNRQGEFTINGLAPGTYKVRVSAPRFEVYEQADVAVTAGQKEQLTIALAVQTINANVDVNGDNQVDTDPNNNKTATVLKGADIDALPDDPDELEAALQALAGPLAGPDGGQINIDGFNGGRMPPKESIREIRINQNPFSAEYDRVGFGRIDILTKPGFDRFRGSAFFNFNDESLNSRNPFALNRAPSQTRNFGGFLSGPIKAKKASFFVDVNNQQRDDNAVIAAIVLDPSLNIVSFNQDVTVPTRRFSISPRLDYAINDKNTLTARYSFTRSTSDNQGIGGFSLLSRAYNSTNTQHELNLTESMIINAKTVNETRFRYEFNKREQDGDNSIPTINVSSAFTGGGSQIGLSFNRSNRWELQNYTTTSFGKASQHAVKFGVRLRGVSLKDRSESGYGGTYTFSGFLDNRGTPDNPDDDVYVTSIEQYRQKILGNPDPRYNPNQFSITTGNPLADVSQYDYGVFITDDWKARQDLTLSFGLRYENQNNLKDGLNFAPRFGFAWSPGAGGARQPKTVFRGGFGIFYDRFGENNTLRARRNDGISQLQYIVTSNQSNLLGQAVFSTSGITNVPTAAQLATVAPQASTPFRIAGDLQSPYSIQSAVSVERQMPFKTVLSATYTMSKSLHLLRTRNINAPVCPNIQVCPSTLTTSQIQLLRPDPTTGNVYQIESSGYSNTQMLAIGVRANINPKVSINGGYTLSFAKGDTDSLTSPRFAVNTVGFPAYSYDLSSEYAPSAFNARHSVFLFGSVGLPFGFRMSSMVFASTGRPFNITSGVDTNRDSLFFERPTFTELANRCQVLGLTNSWCDISGVANPDTTTIPRNYGRGPGSLTVNMNLSRTFGFGGPKKSTVATNNQSGQGNQNDGGRRNNGGGGGNRGGGGGPMMMGGGGGFFGGGDNSKPYNLTLGINVQNLFNNVNLSSPVGSLTSPSFGRSRSTGGSFGFFGGGGGSANRRVELSMRFSW
ncbi:MAG: carboxypeptidase regulatory-like domain-containing protein [Acidobacteria bacterium]|nr:carboxypeptidase regulatory-like domain-containing protein [Acidobacteriota bacterium]